MQIKPKKSLGQNFLIDKNIINLIVNLANIKQDDTLIEVGPGTGNLTKELLSKNPKKLILIEKDKNLSIKLKKQFEDKIILINEDILKLSEKKLVKEQITIFGNLPYNISTQILAKWIKIKNLNLFCKKFILMFQKEVADRIIAEFNTSNYGRLSIICNWKLNIKKICDIKPEAFSPKPKIHSSLLFFYPKEKFIKIKNPSNLEKVTRVFFNQRRKMIKNPLKKLFKDYNEISDRLNIDLKQRPQNLSIETYLKITEEYEKLRS